MPWQRVVRVIGELIADGVVTIALMIIIYAVGSAAKYLGIDKEVIVHNITIGDIIHGLHAANLLVNGYFALKHLVTAHRSDNG